MHYNEQTPKFLKIMTLFLIFDKNVTEKSCRTDKFQSPLHYQISLQRIHKQTQLLVTIYNSKSLATSPANNRSKSLGQLFFISIYSQQR
jgi:hypothetical protein